MEILESLLAIEKMRRKVQARSFKQITTGNAHANVAGITSDFEKQVAFQISRLTRSLDLLEESLHSHIADGSGQGILTQSLLLESFDMQQLLREEDKVAYDSMRGELIAESRTEGGGTTRRRRSQGAKRKCFRKANTSFPREFGPTVPGDLSDDDAEFVPDSSETDEDFSDDGLYDYSDAEEPVAKKKRGSRRT